MARTALALHTDRAGHPADAASILNRLAEASIQVIPQAEHVVLLTCTYTHTWAPSSGQIVNQALRELLHADNERVPGLCVSAAAGGHAMTCDIREERRWPQMSAVASRWGLVGLCATPVRTPGSPAVLLWASHDIIGEDAAAAAWAWSVHVGIALTAAGSRGHFGAALTSRDVIGQAKAS